MFKNEYRIIKKSKLFDEKYYLKNYEDVKKADIDAIKHYIKSGWKEGRNPSDSFDTNFYLQKYEDVRISNLNPLVHYIKYGIKEDRATHPEKKIIMDKTRKIRKLAFIINYIKRNPHILKKTFVELRKNGFSSVIQKINKLELNKNCCNESNNIDLFIKNNLDKRYKIVRDVSNVEYDEIKSFQVAIHLHIYYTDLIDYFVKYLNNMPYTYDLYVSILDKKNKDFVKSRFKNRLKYLNSIFVEEVPNRGRNIAPLIVQFGPRLLNYDYIAHIHSKKSIHNKRLDSWLDGIMDALFNSKESIKCIIKLLSKEIKFVYPENKYENVIYHNGGWSGNYEIAESILNKYTNLRIVDFEYVDFPQGFMFWARKDALNNLLTLPLNYNDFETEPIGTDGSLAHALERLPFILSNNLKGYNYTISTPLLKDKISLGFMDDYNDINFIKKLILFSLMNNVVSLSIVHMETISSLGGVQRYLWFDTIKLNQNSIDSVILFKSKDGIGMIINNFLLKENFKINELVDIILLLKNKYYTTLSIHHCLNWSLADLDCILRLGIEMVTFFHDDYCIRTEEFNNLFSSAINHNSKKEYEELYKNLLKNSNKLVFPSEFIMNKFLGKLPNLKEFTNKIVVSENLNCEFKKNKIYKFKNNKLKIAFLGYKAEHKGWKLFQSIFENKELRSRYDLYHIGADDTESNILFTNVVSNYKNKDISPELLLKKYNIDIVLLFSKLEESYSYTMYEAMASNACIITSEDSGNICDMVKRGRIYGEVLPTEQSVVDFLIDYDNVMEWIKRNPNKNEINIEHNSFILKYIKEEK